MKSGGKLRQAGRRPHDQCAPRLKPVSVNKKLWDLKLYIAGMTPNASRALSELRTICEQHLPGPYRITVVDLREHPRLARGQQILAVPTLVRRLPPPMRRIIGDLSDTEKVLVGLDLAQSAPRN